MYFSVMRTKFDTKLYIFLAKKPDIYRDIKH